MSRFAARELEVVLTGEGADELFAGYRYHGDYADVPDVLQRELRRSLGAMQNSNLQRVDRMSMAHWLEARVPFLDTEVIDVAMAIPAELKLRQTRRAPCREVDPAASLRGPAPSRDRLADESQFDEGSGTAHRLASMASQAVGDRDWRSWTPPDSSVRLRSVEESSYFDHLRTDFADYEALSHTMTMWSHDRLPPKADLT